MKKNKKNIFKGGNNNFNSVNPGNNKKNFFEKIAGLTSYNFFLSLFFFLTFIIFFFQSIGSNLLDTIKIEYIQEFFNKYFDKSTYNNIKDLYVNKDVNEKVKKIEKNFNNYNISVMNNLYIYLFVLIILIYIIFFVDLLSNYENNYFKYIGIILVICCIITILILKFIQDKEKNKNINIDNINFEENISSNNDNDEIENFSNKEDNDNYCYYKREKNKNITYILIFSSLIVLFIIGYNLINKKYKINNNINDKINDSFKKNIYLMLLIIILFSFFEVIYFIFVVKNDLINYFNDIIENTNYSSFKQNIYKYFFEYDTLSDENKIINFIESFKNDKEYNNSIDFIEQNIDKYKNNNRIMLFDKIFNSNIDNNENEGEYVLYNKYIRNNKNIQINNLFEKFTNLFSKIRYENNNLLINYNNLIVILFFLILLLILFFWCLKLLPGFITYLNKEKENTISFKQFSEKILNLINFRKNNQIVPKELSSQNPTNSEPSGSTEPDPKSAVV
jgi:hypothetical protein